MTACIVSTGILQACVRLRGSFLVTLTSTWAALLAGTNLAIASVAVCRSLSAVQALLPPLIGLCTLFCGFTIPRIEDVPVWWRWFSYVNFLRYSFEAQVVNYFGGGNHADLSAEGAINQTVPGVDPARFVQALNMTSLASKSVGSGELVLRFFGMQGMDAWSRVAMQLVFVPVLGALAWGALSYAVVRRR